MSSSSSESPSGSDSDDENVDIAASGMSPTSPLPSSPPRKRKKKTKNKKDNDCPPSFDMKGWKKGDQNFSSKLPEFKETVGINIPIPDDADELYFFQLFIADQVIDNITNETNLYAEQYVEANRENIKDKSRLLCFPDGGMSTDHMKVFLGITYLMGLVHKNNVKDYWSTEDIISTPFFPKIMSRDEYHNILTFFHLSDNEIYPQKGSPDYDPRKKLGFFYSFITSRISSLYTPHQHLSVDEGCIPFKGHVSFKCYNPYKPNKYHIKTFKVVDSVTNYACQFDLYVGAETRDQLNPSITDFGKVHNLVFELVRQYLGKSYIIYMDNWYSSPFLFYNLWLVQTGACGTSRYRKRYPTDFFKTKLKKQGDKIVISGNNIHAIRIYDRKPVCLISTVYDTNPIRSGKTHWKTKEPIMKPSLMCSYNKYMGGGEGGS